MSVRHPPAGGVGEAPVAVLAGRRGGHFRRFPIAFVLIGVCPVLVIPGTESPGAIEQSRLGSQGRRISSAASRQVNDHDRECHQRCDDDADDQFALCRIDRCRRRRYRLGHQAMTSYSQIRDGAPYMGTKVWFHLSMHSNRASRPNAEDSVKSSPLEAQLFTLTGGETSQRILCVMRTIAFC